MWFCMCAIAGMLGLPADPSILDKMLKTMERRGPDDNGIWQEEDCTLLHARLAIIDPQGGRQPMELTWQDEEYILVYNGELYNTQEIRQELLRIRPGAHPDCPFRNGTTAPSKTKQDSRFHHPVLQ